MERLLGLDGLRGMAALLVFVQHFLSILADHGQAWAWSIISTVDLGKLGVAIFFLISGFVIPFGLNRGLAAFWIGRAFRLLPALWLSILLCLALGTPLESATQLFANAFMIAQPMEQRSISGPYWTLGWELYFYAITAVVFAVGALKNPSAFGLAAIGITAVGILHNASYFYLLFMVTGTLLRMVLIEKNEGARPWLYATIGLLVVTFAAWALRGFRPPEYFIGLALALPTFLLFWNRKANSALIWLGGISYSLYLFHLPILEALGRASLPPLAFAASGVVLPFLVAIYVHRWVEAPIMAFSKTWRRRPTAVAIRTSA